DSNDSSPEQADFDMDVSAGFKLESDYNSMNIPIEINLDSYVSENFILSSGASPIIEVANLPQLNKNINNNNNNNILTNSNNDTNSTASTPMNLDTMEPIDTNHMVLNDKEIQNNSNITDSILTVDTNSNNNEQHQNLESLQIELEPVIQVELLEQPPSQPKEDQNVNKPLEQHQHQLNNSLNHHEELVLNTDTSNSTIEESVQTNTLPTPHINLDGTIIGNELLSTTSNLMNSEPSPLVKIELDDLKKSNYDNINKKGGISPNKTTTASTLNATVSPTTSANNFEYSLYMDILGAPSSTSSMKRKRDEDNQNINNQNAGIVVQQNGDFFNEFNSSITEAPYSSSQLSFQTPFSPDIVVDNDFQIKKRIVS
ncbi:hypothetical protein DICPUDRAFT_84068, partial [Dictyostelium purpureum]